MRLSPIAWILLASLPPAARAEDPAPAGRPNVVVILADDMGFSDIGCYGSEIATPNLDRLAREGLRFTSFYNNARCCPTRASLLTGLYPHQAGIGHMVNDRGEAFPAYRGVLNDRCVTIAEVLRGGGYRTLAVGKWHVGEDAPHWPVHRGFDRSFSLISGASNYFRLDPGRTMVRDDRPYTPPAEGFYMTDAFTENALALLDEHGGKAGPFFLYLAYTAPHWPLHARPEDIAKYRGKYRDGWDALRLRRHGAMIAKGIVDARWPLSPRDPEAPPWDRLGEEEKDRWDLKMAVYAAQIDRMDRGIGRVLDKLDALGVADNTLVLFLADNGGCAEVVDRGKPGVPPGPADSFQSYGLPWANASNTPFRRYKHWVHEGGIATPLIARWPAALKGVGGLTPRPGHLIDIMATCVDVAGVEYPRTYRGRSILPPEGKSLRPILEGRAVADAEPRPIFWEHEGNRAVRRGPWKLVSKHPGPWELYDLEADRTELTDLSARHPERVRELAGLYDRWASRCDVRPWEEVRPKKRKP